MGLYKIKINSLIVQKDAVIYFENKQRSSTS